MMFRCSIRIRLTTHRDERGLKIHELFFLCDGLRFDIAPKYYPVLSSLVAFELPGWTVGATGAGAELLA
jgi:hypothetical protein